MQATTFYEGGRNAYGPTIPIMLIPWSADTLLSIAE